MLRLQLQLRFIPITVKNGSIFSGGVPAKAHRFVIYHFSYTRYISYISHIRHIHYKNP